MGLQVNKLSAFVSPDAINGECECTYRQRHEEPSHVGKYVRQECKRDGQNSGHQREPFVGTDAYKFTDARWTVLDHSHSAPRNCTASWEDFIDRVVYAFERAATIGNWLRGCCGRGLRQPCAHIPAAR